MKIASTVKNKKDVPMVAGEARSLKYTPGEPIVESLPVEEGKYEATLADIGKPGMQGWTIKPGKFPTRRLKFDINDTEDELTGAPKQVWHYLTLHPKMLFQLLYMMQSAGYEEEVELPAYSADNTKAPAIRECAEIINAFLDWATENDVTFKLQLSVEEYQGHESNKVSRFLKPDDNLEAAEEVAEEQGPEETTAFDDEVEASSDDGEEDAPAKKSSKKSVTNGASKKAITKPVGKKRN